MSDSKKLPKPSVAGPDARPSVSLTFKADEIPFATNGIDDVPTIFADVIRGTTVLGGVARMNLVEFKADALDDTVKAKHVATIAVPAAQIKAWGEFFTKLWGDLTSNEEESAVLIGGDTPDAG